MSLERELAEVSSSLDVVIERLADLKLRVAQGEGTSQEHTVEIELLKAKCDTLEDAINDLRSRGEKVKNELWELIKMALPWVMTAIAVALGLSGKIKP